MLKSQHRPPTIVLPTCKTEFQRPPSNGSRTSKENNRGEKKRKREEKELAGQHQEEE
jgi:hypothetical protein